MKLRHTAPPVVYPVQRSRLLGCLLVAGWSSGMLVVAAWLLISTGGAARFALALGVTACTGLAAWVGWRNSPSGQLAWDGECWHWDRAGEAPSPHHATLIPIVDLQFALLLLIETSHSARRWVWLERISQPERWMDLRRAVYCVRIPSASDASPQTQ